MDAVTSSSLKLFPYKFSTSSKLSKPFMVYCMKKMKELTLEPVCCSGVGGAFVHGMQMMERPLLIRAAAFEEENNQAIPQITLPLIDFADVTKATSDFARLLGAGGFGEVFYGIFDNGTEVAVKRGTTMKNSLKNEAQLMSLIGNHQNILPALGHIIDENGNFWAIFMISYSAPITNLRIASGLNYLQHELEFGVLLHMDIKLANVLLDANFIPKISDFGLGMLFSHRNSSPIVAKKGVVGTE